jgi:hypothetical protein
MLNWPFLHVTESALPKRVGFWHSSPSWCVLPSLPVNVTLPSLNVIVPRSPEMVIEPSFCTTATAFSRKSSTSLGVKLDRLAARRDEHAVLDGEAKDLERLAVDDAVRDAGQIDLDAADSDGRAVDVDARDVVAVDAKLVLAVGGGARDLELLAHLGEIDWTCPSAG